MQALQKHVLMLQSVYLLPELLVAVIEDICCWVDIAEGLRGEAECHLVIQHHLQDLQVCTARCSWDIILRNTDMKVGNA